MSIGLSMKGVLELMVKVNGSGCDYNILIEELFVYMVVYFKLIM